MIPTVILAGGLGARLGGNKPFHPYGDSTLIETVIDRLRPQTAALYINAGTVDHPLAVDLAALGLPLIHDTPHLANLGPLSGVLSALDIAVDSGWAAVATVPCDMPRLPLDLLARLQSVPSAPVVYCRGVRDYPLCALWRAKACEPLRIALEAARDSGGLAVMRFLDSIGAVALHVVDDEAFLNINSANTTAESHALPSPNLRGEDGA